MTKPMVEFGPEDLAAVFRTLADAGWDAVLVGGQAVNLWACRYEQNDPHWVQLRPYTSRDLDYHGGLAEARLALQALAATGRLNTGVDPSPNAGVLQVGLADGRTLTVDILTTVYGVSAAEVERTAVTWTGTGALADLRLRVMHPLLLLEAKLASLRGLPQSDRQDAKHVRLLTLVLREWLKEQLDDPRTVFRSVERLMSCAASPDGMYAFGQGIDLTQAIPLDEMRAEDTFTTFFQQRLPQLMDKITRKRQRHMEALKEQTP